RLPLPPHGGGPSRPGGERGARPSLAALRLRKWAHMLGFGGHFSTKSRRHYTPLGGLGRAPGSAARCAPPAAPPPTRSPRHSTHLGALRRARVAYAIRPRRGDTVPLDAWGRPEDDQAVIVVASWTYLGRGYQSAGEAWRAASAAARAREARRIAKEELGTTPRAA